MLAKQAFDRTRNKTFDKLFEQLSGGSFTVKCGNGATESYGQSESQFTLKLNDYDIHSLIGDDMLTSFGEAYMDGCMDLYGDLNDLTRDDIYEEENNAEC